MKEFIKSIKDIRVLIPIIIFIVFEIILRSGFYTGFLKKNSYAANINRISNHVLNMQESHNPDILILGTSIAYQGLSTRILQEKIDPTGLKIQSIAIPGSELIVQNLISKKVLKDFNNVKYLIYVAEVTMPWVSQKSLGLPTLAMISEFPPFEVLPLLKEFEYSTSYKVPVFDTILTTNYGIQDLSFLFFKSIAYRRDFNDLLLDPGKRIKYITRDSRNINKNFYYFENTHEERMSSYNFENLDDCIQKTRDFGNPPYPENSNFDHKKAIFDTCALTQHTKVILEQTETTENGDTELTKLYFRRLSKVFDNYIPRGIKIITVFAPYSHTMGEIGGESKMQVWKRELNKLLGENNAGIIDLQNLFSPGESDYYCYDTIHLNKDGMKKFSDSFGEILLKEIKMGNIDGIKRE